MIDRRINSADDEIERLREQLPPHYRNRLTFTPHEASELLGMSVGRIIAMCKSRTLLSKVYNRHYLIDRDSLLLFTQQVEEQDVGDPEEPEPSF